MTSEKSAYSRRSVMTGIAGVISATPAVGATAKKKAEMSEAARMCCATPTESAPANSSPGCRHAGFLLILMPERGLDHVGPEASFVQYRACRPERRPAVIGVYSRQKRAEILLVGDRGPVLHLGCLQGATQEKRRIVLGSQRGDNKPEDGADQAAQPPCSLSAPAAFDPLQQREDFRRRDIRDWSGAKVGAGKIDKQPSVLLDGGRGGALILDALQIFLRDVPEGVPRRDDGGQPLGGCRRGR